MLSNSAYLTILGTSMLFWGGLLWQYKSKWDEKIKSLAKDIRIYNARNGYGSSVNEMDIAREYSTPHRDATMRTLVETHEGDIDEYKSGLKNSVERPNVFFGLVYAFLGLVYTFLGLTYVVPGIEFDPILYLISQVTLYLIGVLLFFLFR